VVGVKGTQSATLKLLFHHILPSFVSVMPAVRLVSIAAADQQPIYCYLGEDSNVILAIVLEERDSINKVRATGRELTMREISLAAWGSEIGR